MNSSAEHREAAALATKRRYRRWSLERVASAARAELRVPPGRPPGEVEAKPVLGAVLDSRRVRSGDLFVALAGERTDGHRYLGEAQAHGAVACLCRGDAEAVEAVAPGGPLLTVDDPEAALQRWGAGRRAAWEGTLIGVTGTSGKTTAKDLLALCLEGAGATHATEGNLNNHLGVPVTLTGLSDDHRFAVVEMGMNHAGEIARLCEWARPAAGVITHVGAAHLEGLGSLEAVARAKAELAEALPGDGFLVVPADSPRLHRVLDEIGAGARRVTFALEGGADWTATGITELGPAGVTFRVEGLPLVRLRLAGRHNVANALAAIACARTLGIEPEAIVAGLTRAEPPAGRMQPVLTGGVTLLLDHYNANPDSMRAALETLRRWPARRRFAALGEMRELGDFDREGHRQVGEAAAFVEELYLVGESTAHVAEGAIASGLKEERVRGFPTAEELGAALAERLAPGDAVLIKGSRAAHMEDAVRVLRERLGGGKGD